jgi:hypothetical protein
VGEEACQAKQIEPRDYGMKELISEELERRVRAAWKLKDKKNSISSLHMLPAR